MGEFAIGVNPYILKPMKDILFDEKIMGASTLLPAAATTTPIMAIPVRNPLGSGDGSRERSTAEERSSLTTVLIRKNGRFVLPELDCLNPENLK